MNEELVIRCESCSDPLCADLEVLACDGEEFTVCGSCGADVAITWDGTEAPVVESFDCRRLVSRHKNLSEVLCLNCDKLLLSPKETIRGSVVVKCLCDAEMLVEETPNWFYVTDVGAE